jgi:hypothetical protein
MNLLSLLDRLSAADASPAAAPRRHLLRELGHTGLRAAALALPLTAALPAQAATANLLDAIRLLLKLEDMLVALYTQGLAGVLGTAARAAVRPDFERLLRQQQNHADFFRSALRTTGLTPPTAPAFDFSGRKNNSANPTLFPDVMSDYSAFLQLAQQLEDASASIYLGQVPSVSTDKPLLDAVLRMQTVEARHASHLRTLRRAAPSPVNVKSWPSAADAAPNPAVQVPGTTAAVSIYAIEANQTQVVSGTNTIPYQTLLTGGTAVRATAVAEAFDEPLSTVQATALLNIFG